MLRCQSAQKTGLSNHKLKSALIRTKVHHMITMHARPRYIDRCTDEWTAWQ